MNKKEYLQIQENFLQIYNGIIANNPLSTNGLAKDIIYNFDCPEFIKLKEKYNLEEIAGKGNDFSKAKRLLNYFSKRLYHSSYYDNHIECNALDLLEYSFENKNQGINCLNKSKILQECLLAIGIYARRCFMMPYSPFDMDNHVVVEIYDRNLNKWIMLDPTSNCYVVDKDNKPLSLFEMREAYGNNQKIFPIKTNQKKFDYEKQYNDMLETIVYYSKNCFCFFIDAISTFGDKDGVLVFAPITFNFGNWNVQNSKFRIQYIKEHKDEIENPDKLIEWAEKRLETSLKNIDSTKKLNNIDSYLLSPIKE